MADRSDFVHLHVHSEYSLLDGAARLKRLVERAAHLGFPALALTDHGNLFGAIDFYQHARAAGIKPILGCELDAFCTAGTSPPGCDRENSTPSHTEASGARAKKPALRRTDAREGFMSLQGTTPSRLGSRPLTEVRQALQGGPGRPSFRT